MADDQVKEMRDIIRSAQRQAVPTHTLRKDVLRRLVELGPSTDSALKKLAADNIPKFFKVFPDLEEDAINAIYDLCEDQDSKVRMDGYKAIVQMSKEQPKLVKRNADVLVQLLQSDEPDEVVVVKKALAAHLDMDSKVTLGVLCDQIAPPLDSSQEDVDDEDIATRERLRSLVLTFMVSEAKRIERHASRAGSEQEGVLIDGLLRAINTSSPSDTVKIVKGLLLPLAPYRAKNSIKAGELLNRLLARVKLRLAEDLESNGELPTISNLARELLELASYVNTETFVANPRILHFCMDNITLSSIAHLAADAKVFLVVQLGESWSSFTSSQQTQDRDLLRKYVTECTGILLPGVVELAPKDTRVWNAVESLLLACQERSDKFRYNIPATAYEQIIQLASETKHLNLQRVQDIANSLVARHNSGMRQGSREPRSKKNGRRRSPSPEDNKRKVEDTQSDHRISQAAASTRPSAPPSVGLSIRGQSSKAREEVRGQERESRSSPHPKAQAESHPSTNESHGFKRQRVDESHYERDAAPHTELREARRSRSQSPSRNASPETYAKSGFNIKGAASRGLSQTSTSLLTRMGHEESTSTSRKRRRGGRGR